MIQRIVLVLALLIICLASGFAQADLQGAKDHPLFTRMPGYYIDGFEVKDFESYVSPYLPESEATWEGKTTRISYQIKDGASRASMTQIERNYEVAFKKIGGTKLYSDGRVFGGKIVKDGATCYVHVEPVNEGSQYSLLIIESGKMKQDVVADAAAFSASIAATGKVALYGIYFDTGKSIMKAESTPTLEQVARLLKEDPKLKLYVIGHTDNDGTAEANLQLSADRADAVVRALLGQGVKAPRLKAAGVGPYCPVSTNHTEEGKAQNRRVELVEQ
jgi:outer membrane protein OmpA-like peptidoglycan-associated protein